VIYTRSRNEQVVAKMLEDQGVKCFLPMHKVLRFWKDRKKLVNEPLIKAYVFVYVASENHYLKIIRTEGVVCFINFEGKAARVPDKQIENLKLLVSSGKNIQVTGQKYDLGDHVVVDVGPMKGLEGMLVMVKNRHKVQIRLDHIDKSIMVDINPGKLIKKGFKS